MRKVCVVGCGNVGIAYVHELMLKGDFVESICLIDVDKDKVEGEVLDLSNTMAFNDNLIDIQSGEYKDCFDADVVVITAGRNQQSSEESRLDMLKDNAKIVSCIIKEIEASGFKGVYIIATNPVDLVTLLSLKECKISANRIFGTGTTLDTARLKCVLGKKLCINPKSINAYVLGEHGDSEFVAWSKADISGVDIKSKLSLDDKKNIEKQVRDMAYEIIEKKGYTNFGVSSCLFALTKAILCDEGLVYTVSVYDEDEDMCYSMPAIVNACGIGAKLKIQLDDFEVKQLKKSVKCLKKCLK